MGKPPQNITPKAFFERLLNQFSALYKKNGKTTHLFETKKEQNEKMMKFNDLEKKKITFRENLLCMAHVYSSKANDKQPMNQ